VAQKMALLTVLSDLLEILYRSIASRTFEEITLIPPKHVSCGFLFKEIIDPMCCWHCFVKRLILESGEPRGRAFRVTTFKLHSESESTSSIR
jgi:hypothetical protein